MRVTISDSTLWPVLDKVTWLIDEKAAKYFIYAGNCQFCSNSYFVRVFDSTAVGLFSSNFFPVIPSAVVQAGNRPKALNLSGRYEISEL